MGGSLLRVMLVGGGRCLLPHLLLMLPEQAARSVTKRAPISLITLFTPEVGWHQNLPRLGDGRTQRQVGAWIQPSISKIRTARPYPAEGPSRGFTFSLFAMADDHKLPCRTQNHHIALSLPLQHALAAVLAMLES